MKRLALALALACILSGVAHAGEIHSTGAVAPHPSGPPATTTSEIPTTGATELQASSTVVSIILTLINIVR